MKNHGCGKFIVFEGGDGVGKTTQAQLLADALQDDGKHVLLTREPGGCREAGAIRSALLDGAADWSPESEVLLHTAARIEHVRKVIDPALRSGEWVVCDRFSWSTVAYQCAGAGAPTTLVSALREFIATPFPDLVILIDAAVDVGASRVASRSEKMNRYDAMDAGYRGRVRQAFLNLHACSPCYSVVIDGDQSVGKVQQDIQQAVAEWRGHTDAFKRAVPPC